MTAEDEVRAYFNELGITSGTVTQLIESHRYLRGLNLENNNAISDAVRRAYEHSLQKATENQTAAMKKMNAMSFGDVLTILQDHVNDYQ